MSILFKVLQFYLFAMLISNIKEIAIAYEEGFDQAVNQTFTGSKSFDNTFFNLLIYAKIENGWRYCDARQNVGEQLTLLSYAKQMWGVFRLIIKQSVEEVVDNLGDKVEKIMATIDNNILRFFTQVLQLDQRTLALET